MTGDLKEAFTLACVKYAGWQLSNDEIRHWGHERYNGSGDLSYWPEPTVQFFGRDLPISVICQYARVLSGPLPPVTQALFDHLIWDGCDAGIEIRTWPDAVNTLEGCIEGELDLMRSMPIGTPTIADGIRHRTTKAVLQVLGRTLAGKLLLILAARTVPAEEPRRRAAA